jgi:hypothetical protein
MDKNEDANCRQYFIFEKFDEINTKINDYARLLMDYPQVVANLRTYYHNLTQIHQRQVVKYEKELKAVVTPEAIQLRLNDEGFKSKEIYKLMRNFARTSKQLKLKVKKQQHQQSKSFKLNEKRY